jgi:hypothetical protein
MGIHKDFSTRIFMTLRILVVETWKTEQGLIMHEYQNQFYTRQKYI